MKTIFVKYESDLIKWILMSILTTLQANAVAGDYSWTPQVGLGYDSNIYRAPSGSYNDYSKDPDPAVAPIIDPVTKSGIFATVKLKGEYVSAINDNNRASVDYKVGGDFYLDSKYSNANQYGYKVRGGNQYIISPKGKINDSLYTGVFFSHKKRLYLDRDTGDEQVVGVGGTDVSDRYTYDTIGAEILFNKTISSYEYKLKLVSEKRDYVDAIAISQYDNDYFLAGGDVSYRASKETKYTFRYDFYTYDYKNRPSRNSDGRLLSGNPKRKYEYNRLKVTVRHRVSKSWLTYLDLERKERNDLYLSYDDYTKNLLKIRAHYKLNRNNLIKLSFSTWKRDYPNAFAFDRSVQGQKKYDGINIKLRSKTRIDKSKSVMFELKYTDENSTDLRYSYDRLIFKTNASWDL